jgi:hypothetical protein
VLLICGRYAAVGGGVVFAVMMRCLDLSINYEFDLAASAVYAFRLLLQSQRRNQSATASN